MAENPTSSPSLAEIRAKQTSTRGKDPRGVEKKPARPRDTWSNSLLWAFVIAFTIRIFFFEAFRIPTGSMKNTLLVGDHLFVNKIGYFLQTPRTIPFTSIQLPHLHMKTGTVHRGDVIVFEYPGDQDVVEPREKGVNYIKRCVGEPGDVIQVRDKQLYVNGKIFANPPESRMDRDTQKVGFVDPRIFPKGAQWNKDNYGPIRVPKQGDHITITRDNLEQWAVFIAREGHRVELISDRVMIDGRPNDQYVVQRDYLWMMGDNRDDSEDSRFWGFAPMDNVIGGGMFIYWSWYHPPDGQGDGYDSEEEPNTHVRFSRIGRIIH